MAAPALAGAACFADVAPRVDRLGCPPAGIAAVPLVREAGDEWPRRVDVSVGGLNSTAPVVWVGARPDDGARPWTRSPEQYEVRPIESFPAGSEPESVGDVLALVSLPAGGDESIEVAGRRIRVHWLPEPRRVRADAPVLPVPPTSADDRPDPGTPAEHWRWAVLAERQGARIAEPRGDAAARALARSLEGLWLGGLERVRSQSAGIHAELVDLLAGVAEDREGGRTVAAWVARPAELRALLAILIDPQRTDAEVAQAALTWARERWACTAWVAADAGDRVQLAIANPTAGERSLRAVWRNSAGESLPAAVVAPPRRLVHVWLDRPALRPQPGTAAADRARTESIDLSDGTTSFRVAAGAREYPVRPPGLWTGTFAPPLTLAEAQASVLAPADAAWRTELSLRKRGERWEMLVEAFRPADASDPASDRVTVRLGDPASPTHEFAVTADGALEVSAGRDDGVSAGFMSWGDRWRARVELPESWLPSAMPGARPFLFAAERTPGSVRARQTAGLALPPWAHAAPVLVDLSAWDDLGR